MGDEAAGTEQALPCARHPDGTRLAVRLTPRGGRDSIDGIGTDANGRPELKVRIAAAPVDGAANAALVALLARALDVRRSAVQLLSGATGRSKTLLIADDPDRVAERLAALVQR